jgi:hypothetical protein
MMLLGVVLLVVAACGGGSTEEDVGDDGGDPPTATQPADDGESNDSGSEDQTPPATEADSDDSVGEGPSTATVTIGDETYEFSTEVALVAQCVPDLFGIMSVILPLSDGGDGNIQIIALHEGTDPAEVEQTNSVLVKIGDDDWIADPEDVRFNGDPDTAALSHVDSVEVNGSTLTGTASFVGRDNVTFEWVSMTGTFEATCGEERFG